MMAGTSSIVGAPKSMRWRIRSSRAAAIVWLVVTGGAVASMGVAWLAEWRIHVIETSSMSPSVPAGSLAIIRPATAPAVARGDVIVFRDPTDRRRRILHRVTEIVSEPSGLFFQTQGDANRAADPLLVPDDDVEARLQWHVPRLGAAASALRTPTGMLVLIGGPVGCFMLGEARRRRRHFRKVTEPSRRSLVSTSVQQRVIPYSRPVNEFYEEFWATSAWSNVAQRERSA